MAGNYPDVPAPRMPYDRDGSTTFRINQDNTVTELIGANSQALNDESGSAVNTNSQGGTWTTYFGVIFPQLRDISGFAISARQGGDYVTDLLQTSVDSTNGIDGTWITQISSPAVISSTVTPAYRSSITPVAYNGIRGVRFRARKILGAASGSQTCYAIHIYGAIANYAGMDTLRIWHPTLDEPLDDNTSADGAYFDWGDRPRTVVQTKTFRVKNNSAVLTANSIVITQEALTNTTPSVPAQYTFSNGGAFSTSLNIGNLAPGALSSVITKQFSPPSNAVLSVWTSRTTITPGSWV